MNANTHPDAADALSELGALNTGLGVLSMTLFPFALPLLILTAAAVVPLLLLAIPLAVPVGLFLLIRRIVRRVAAARPAARSPLPLAADAQPNVNA